MSPPGSRNIRFGTEVRRQIGRYCAEHGHPLSEIAGRLRRPTEGSVQGTVNLMVKEGLLFTTKQARSGARGPSYQTDPRVLDELQEAERMARRPGADRTEAPVIKVGQRLLMIGGDRLAELSQELRRHSLASHAEWIARLDGGSRVLVCVGTDDGARCDEIEAAINKIDGLAVQGRIDRFMDGDDYDHWIRGTS